MMTSKMVIMDDDNGDIEDDDHDDVDDDENVDFDMAFGCRGWRCWII